MNHKLSTPYDNMIFFKAHHKPLHESITEDGEVFVGKSDRPWVYMRSNDEKALQRLVRVLPKEYVNFALVEDWMVDILARNYKRTREMVCTRFYLPDDVILPHGDAEVTMLLVEDAEEIQNSHAYNEYTDLDYVRSQIENGYGAGVRITGKLVAWAITHDDGAIGFMYVKPEYRNKGYAESVTAFIAERLRRDGFAVYVHIEGDNVKSMNLAKKLGFVEDRKVRWFTLEEVQND